MSIPFLLEIGAEEIPDWMIEGALKQLGELFQALLDENKLGGKVTSLDATPRRLVLRAEGLAAKQADQVQPNIGPPSGAGVKAAEGFARKMGVAVSDLTINAENRYSFDKQIAGRETSAILADALPGIILKLYFPKTMYWTGKGGPRFIRPIRWIVALLGAEVVPFELAGVRSGNVTSGHRRLGAKQIEVTVNNFETKLLQNFVIVSAAERRKKIEAEMAAFNVQVKSDEKLLHTLTYITEYPTPILGEFAEEYLQLPAEVLTTVMRHHQKYFSVVSEKGLAPKFIAVMNINGDPDGLVKRGNERVLRARFNDARFFWEVDQHKKLADRLDDLAHVTFQAKLGSYLEKTKRVAALANELGGAAAERAATLSKCDLPTEMVKEFTDLQGIVGGLYARVQGETEEVAQAIYEHYKPLSMEDSIPSTRTGQIVSLADKLDTLRGCFQIDLIPSGSKDPFALRRAAQGVVKILVEGNLEFSMAKLLGGDERLIAFFLERLKHYFREIRGYKYDEVNAVLAAGWDNLPDAARRLEAIQAVRPTADFEPLAASFKRIKNILTQANFAGLNAVDATLFEDGAERQLWDAKAALRIEGLPYREALEQIASLRPKVDEFFNKVLVNAPDAQVRENRLAMLAGLLTEFSSIADFSEIVTS
jgi:glycyl-tRNA synthetase beta chain